MSRTAIPHAKVLEVQRAREPIEQALPAAEDDRRDDDRQFVDEAGAESLANDVRSSHDMHILALGGFHRSLDGLLHAAHERGPKRTSTYRRALTAGNEGRIFTP
jgi:hypothetical protein